MRVREGSRPAVYVDGDEVYAQIRVADFPEDKFWELLNRDPRVDDTRSQVLQVRLPNGDLILGFYPQGDSYFEIEGLFV